MSNKANIKALAVIFMAMGLMIPVAAGAQVVTAGTTNTQVINAPNGVPVVNIANPNASGLSHNQFNSYNVDTRGLVLNNGDSTQISRVSQLAGVVSSNLNLTKQASTILNEVVQPNRSLLAGYTEVLGGAADVIVANPYGITCNGCGFINTPNATLTTGTPVKDANGALTGFQVNAGDILITGNGLDATQTDYLALLARSMKIEGQINAKALDLVAGANDWDDATRTAAARAGTGAVPTLAIDTSVLGGMYANRIRLIATEAGVGVKLLGEAASGVDDFTINAAGKIEIGNKVSSHHNLSITTTDSSAGAISMGDQTLSALNDLTLSAVNSALSFYGGTLTAGHDLSVTSASLADALSNLGTTDNNKRYAGHNLTLTQTGATTLDGTNWGAANAFTGSAASLTLNNADGATLYGASLNYSTSGAMNLNKGSIKTTGDLSLTATNNTLAIGASQNVQSTGGNLSLTGATVTNAGTVTADDTSTKTLTANATSLTNSGTLHSGNALALNILTTLTNSNNILGDKGITVRGLSSSNYTVNNSALMQSANGTIAIDGYNGGHVATVNASGVNALFLGHDLNWNVSSIALQSSNNGLKATNDLTVITDALTFANSNDYIYAGHNGTLTVYNGLSDNASIYAVNNMSVTGNNLTTTSTGAFAAGGTLTLNSNKLNRAGNVTGSGNIINNGALYGGANLVATAANLFNNTSTGTINGAGNASFTADTFTNNNDINILGSATISANTFHNDISGVTIGWDYLDAANGFDGSEGGCMTYGNQGAGFPNGCNDGRTAAQARYHSGTSDIQVSGWQLIDTNGNNINGPYQDTCDYSGAFCNDTTDRYLAKFYTDQKYIVNGSYINGKPSASLIPTLLAGTLTIKDFTTATNTGGLISANTVNINSTKPGATFTNDDMHLERYDWKAWWDEFQDCDAVNNCGSWQYRSYDKWVYQKETLSADSITAGIYANTLNASGFALNNVSSVFNPVNSATSAPTTGTGGSFAGLTITLPTNPNGFFITSQDPNSHYLVETNPKFADPSQISSDYMAKQYGLDLTSLEKRLGDGAYETTLIRQQLISDLGTNLIDQSKNEAQQMQSLMDNGVSIGKQLGLQYGKAPTAAQLAGLGKDFVWMVDTVVNGQHVLAPVVYLSAATKSMFTGGATIAAKDVNMNLTSLTNTGGTISGSNTLNVTSKGDITNTAGTIKGGDVSLKSTEGSIVNKTIATTTGGSGDQITTDISKTGSISSSGNLSLDAKKDITNIGADMSAGKDASLKAGNNITFDTIENKKSSTAYSESHSGLNSSSTATTTSSTTNIGSNLKVGGNLTTDSGKDTTIRGSNVDVKGNGDMHAGGNLNILDVQDTNETQTITSQTGVGVGGGVYGTQKDTDNDYHSHSKGSMLSFGGNANLSADKDLTIQGSDLNATGDTSLSGDTVNILEGRNVDNHSHKTETTTFLSVDDSSGNSDSSSDTDGADADASAGAHASASAGGEGGISFAKTSTHEVVDNNDTAKGSNVKTGGNLNIKSNKDTNVRGSNVEAGGDVGIAAGGNLNVKAAEDVHTHHETSSTTSIGLHASSANSAEAGADAEANADDGGATASANGSSHGAGADVNAGDAKADASAKAGAHASSDNTLDLMTTTTTTTDSKDVTHTGSSIKSGGNTRLKAQKDVNIEGSSVDAGGDLDVEGKDINVTASHDTHTSKTTTSTTKVGLYATAGADADASAGAGAGVKDGASAEAGASADANAGVGLYGTNTTSTDTHDSTHANTSSLKSGGNLTRKASDTINDEGTQIEVGGDFTQDAKTWNNKAAHDTESSTHSSETNTAKVGLYADANASASASGEAGMGKPSTDTDSGADASAGISASYHRDTDNSTSDSSHAVVSNIKAGGKVKSTTSGKTSLEGTNIESGGDTELNADSLDYKAAHDTSSSTSSKDNIDANLKVGVDATKAVTGSVSGSYGNAHSTDTSDTAVTGSMKSGGKLSVRTKNDATFEGTNIDAGGDASVKSDDGNVTFNAAHNTSTHTEDSMDVSASLSASKSKGGGSAGGKGKGSSKMGAEASFDMANSKESKSDAVTGSIKSGGKLDVSAGKDATFEGTGIESKGDASIDAGGSVNMKAAKSTSSKEGYSVGLSASVTKESGGKSGEESGKTTSSTAGGAEGEKKKGADMGLKAEGGYEKSDSSTSTTGSVKSGGNLKIKSGKDTTLEGTDVDAAGKASIDAGGSVNMKAATDTSTDLNLGGSLEVGRKSGEKSGKVGVDLSGSDATTKKGGSIKGGSIDIKSSGDTTLEGTKVDSKGDTSIDAGGNLNLDAAKSTHIDGSLKGDIGSDGGMLKDAGIGGGVQNDGVNMTTGGNLNLKSGGKTTMTGTKAKVEGKATIDAKGGEEEKAAVSGGGQIGTSRAGADIDVEETDIDAKGGVSKP